MKVIEYLERVCRIYQVPETRAYDMLDKVELQREAYTRKIKGLSAGMYQKFAVAHALIHQPDFIIADEPTSNLDPRARNDLINLIITLNQTENTTFLISSHILPEINKVCDSISIINDGKIALQGSLTKLQEKFNTIDTRISADEPKALAQALEQIEYIERMIIQANHLFISVNQDKTQSLYEDILRVAKRDGLKILGIESKKPSLDDIFRYVIGENEDD